MIAFYLSPLNDFWYTLELAQHQKLASRQCYCIQTTATRDDEWFESYAQFQGRAQGSTAAFPYDSDNELYALRLSQKTSQPCLDRSLQRCVSFIFNGSTILLDAVMSWEALTTSAFVVAELAWSGFNDYQLSLVSRRIRPWAIVDVPYNSTFLTLHANAWHRIVDCLYCCVDRGAFSESPSIQSRIPGLAKRRHRAACTVATAQKTRRTFYGAETASR